MKQLPLGNRVRERGSVLLLVFVITSLLVAAVLSNLDQSDALIEVARDESTIAQANLLAESGISYGRARLMADSGWQGTGGAQLELAPGQTFAVAAVALNPGVDDGLFRLQSYGFTDEGQSNLQAEIVVLAGMPLDHEAALVFLGGEFQLLDSTVIGDLLISDVEGVVEDKVYDPILGWYDGPAGPVAPLDFDFDGTTVLGDLYKFSETTYFAGNEEHQINSPLSMPEFDLGQYLDPGPDRIIYYYENNLKNVAHEETAVFVLDPGQNLSLDSCYFPGGVIVYVDPAYNPMDGELNKVLLKHQTTIGGGTGGVSPYLGMVAPGCEVQFTHPGCALESDHNDIDGFTVFNKVHLVKEARFNGVILILKEIKHFRRTIIVYDPEVAANIPAGINFSLPGSSSRALSVSERYQYNDDGTLN